MNDVIFNPDYLAYRINFKNECVDYLRVDSAEMRRVAWLRHTSIDPHRKFIAAPLAEVVGAYKNLQQYTQDSAPRFIFHTAYCASTYLSRCVDVPDHSLSLREPQVLLDAANAKRLQWSSQTANVSYRDLPALAVALLSKHRRDSEILIIKPINSVNNIIPEILSAVPQAKAVMLYTDARNFVLSALKKGESARHTIRAMFDLLRCDFPHLSNLSISDAIRMSDLKLILTFWRLQIEQAEAAIQHNRGAAQISSLYAEKLVEQSFAGLSAVDRFLELGLGSGRVDEIAHGQESQRDAKQPTEPFSLAIRNARYAELEQVFGQDVDNGLAWLTSNNPSTSLAPTLSADLAL